MEHAQRPVGPNEPVMVAWNAHKATEDYANTLRWAGQSNEGNLWAMFLAGFGSGCRAGAETSMEVASIAGELLNLELPDFLEAAALGGDRAEQLLDKIHKVAASALGQTR